MPRLTVWMVRTSLLQLGIGFTVGMLMLFNKGVPFDPSIWRLLPIHIEMVLAWLDDAVGDGRRLLGTAALFDRAALWA